MMLVQVAPVPTGVASATPVDGCVSGTLTVHRNVAGYEFWDVEQGQQVERLPNTDRRFPSELRYTVVTFATAGNVTADCTWTVPEGVTRGHLLVVGGGGAGGTAHGGGGGGGGVFYGKVPITSTLGAVFDPGAVLQLTVGVGGTPAAEVCVGADCAGGEGGVSSVSSGGVVRVSAGGGGGGGGDGQSARAVQGIGHSAGGGGGGAALTDDGTPVVAGAAGASSTVANDPYRDHPGGLLGGGGGPGEAGTASGATRYSGGGGGAKGRAGGGIGSPGVGAGGVGITFSQGGPIFVVDGGIAQTIGIGVYGAGGGGFERGLGNCGPGPVCFSYFAKGSASPASGGAGGTSGSGGQGVDGTGGGGGGAAGQGGRGGAGIVMIAFPEPIVVTGSTVLAGTFGAASTSTAYAFTNGNSSLVTRFRVRAVGSTAIADSPPAGISMSAGRQIVVSTSAAPGTYDLVVLAVNDLGTEGSLAVTLTVSRAAQQLVTFTTTPPADARIGFGAYSPALTGGDGTGAYVIVIDPTVPPVCSIAEGIISFLNVGTCTVVGSRDGDGDFEASATVVQNFSITARDAQAAVVFATAAPSGAVAGDAGDQPQFSGGSGTGAFVLTSLAADVCATTLAGSTWQVAHLAPGTCELSVVRDGDGQHLDSTPTVRAYAVAPDCGPLVDGRHLVSTAAHLASVGAGGAGTGACGLGASYLQTADISLPAPVAPATSNHVPIGSFANPFTGTYDGGGLLISTLTVQLPVDDHVGMFGRAFQATLRDVRLTDVVIVGRDYVGALAGLQSGAIVAASVSGRVEGRTRVGGLIGSLGGDSAIEDSSSAAVVVGTGNEVGGLVGVAQGGDVRSSDATGAVSGVRQVGGLVGHVSSGSTSITTSFATGDVAAIGNDAGGLVGENSGTISASFASGGVATTAQGVGGLVGTNFNAIEDSFATGSVGGSSGLSMAGGLVGGQFGSGTISRSFSVGQVTGGGAAGLLQFLDGYAPTASFWDTTSTGRTTSAGGTGLPSLQLRSIDIFVDAGWSITPRWAAYVAGQSVWGLCSGVNDGYPFLLWQFNANPCSAPEEASSSSLAMSCDGTRAAGTKVTCTVTGGDADIEILWRAAYNPVIAEAVVTLDASGAGTFRFVVPAAALGEEVTVELVAWAAPVSLGVSGGPVPTSVPSGEGPVPVWTLGLLALAGGLALRRGSRLGPLAPHVG